ncbi:MAG: primosomal protein N' (replication factor Y) - superfamily II helicase, partial [Rhodobacteraceae bacterium]|nr:primosomal protein N' (replication factor Y) - superfamily II helicase [Paracoccaceae bacterium]
AERPLSGVYLPFWTFDADARAAYRGARGTVHHVTRSRFAFRDGKRVQIQQRVPKVRWTPVSGMVRRRFDDVLVTASRTLPPSLLERLGGLRAGWDLHDLRPYSPEFLAGYRAEAYQIDLEEGFSASRAMMEVQLRRDVRFDIGGDRQRVDALDTRLNDVSFKHVLLPVWIAAYRYRGDAYRFIVNARTGEVIGERPYSTWKIAAALVTAALVIAGVAYVAGGGGF